MPKTVSIDDVTQMSGVELGVSDWLTIDQDRVSAFADATLDHQWIHVDVDRAREKFGGTIAHGFLSLSLLVHLMDQVVAWEGVSQVINYGSNKVQLVITSCSFHMIEELLHQFSQVFPRRNSRTEFQCTGSYCHVFIR